MKIIAVIPARYESSRFQGKPLAEICGKTMIERVYLQAKKVTEFNEVYVATDHELIYQSCQERRIPVIMTSSSHQTGTDRIGEVAEKINADLYVNIQGDEPLIEPETIRKVLSPFIENSQTDIKVVNLMTEIKDPVDLINFTVPKVIAAKDGRGVYLTRSPAPFPKGSIDAKYYKQVCVYAFTPEALQFYCAYGKQHGKAKVEAIEDIEILRFIENGYHVHFIEVDSETIAVDTPKDLARVIQYMMDNKITE